MLKCINIKSKAITVTIILCVILSTTAIPFSFAQPNFSDDFETATINSEWDYEGPYYSTIGLSSEQAYSGSQSVKFIVQTPSGYSEAKLVYFCEQGKGTIITKIYDTMQGHIYATLSAFNTEITPLQSFGLGIMDWDYNDYHFGITDVGNEPVYPRSLGWHELKIIFNADNVELFIDNTLVKTVTGDYTFNKIAIGTQSIPGVIGVSYFDDFSLIRDTTPPSINIISPVEYGVYSADSGESYEFDVTDDFDLNVDVTATIESEGNMIPVQSGSPLPTQSGLYTLTISATDDAGLTTTKTVSFNVYDPEGGFVTGAGWINSPEGAYAADETLAGKATFGFVSKYKKGASVPEGNTEFIFHAGDLKFSSTSYEWLVVAGTKAMFKGEGTINGEGTYTFLLSAIDNGNTGDIFRMQITEVGGGLVYDNGPGQEISGGSIIVHSK